MKFKRLLRLVGGEDNTVGDSGGGGDSLLACSL